MTDFGALAWPVSRAADAVRLVAAQCGLPARTVAAPPPPDDPLDEAELSRWVQGVAAWLGLEAEPVDTNHAEVSAMLKRAPPALIRLPGEARLLVAVAGARDAVTLLAPDLEQKVVPLQALRDLYCKSVETKYGHQVDGMLLPLAIDDRRRARVKQALIREQLRGTRVGGCWLLRAPPSSSFWAQIRFDRLPLQVIALFFAHSVQFFLGIAGWYLLGRGALQGRLDRDWLLAWGLILLTAIPLRLLTVWIQGTAAIGLGQLLRRRLMAGALRIDADLLRREGSGQLLGRALESSAVESLALSGGFLAVLACAEVVSVAVILGLGQGGVWHAAFFTCWIAVTGALGWRVYVRGRRWTDERRALTNDLVEQMVGHRTRLAQQPPWRWHEGEDDALDRYLESSASMDRNDVVLQTLPRGWFLVGLLGLAPTFIAASSTSPATLAVSLGGVLLGAQALSRFSTGLAQVAAARIAWEQARVLFAAAARPEPAPSPEFVTLRQRDAEREGALVLEANDLTFSYAGRQDQVIRGASLRIHVGDRLLLEGPSGGGKSTFTALLAGLRAPSSGLLLLDGLDWHTLGQEGWRRRIACAPQFQDNHVLTETFAFNLLMGRGWPAEEGDYREAGEVCHELGLGELVARMPGNLNQMVGETGWRLSHGERSRLYIARALLQDARLVILDESFAALDPETLKLCLSCAIRRAQTLLVVAHP